MTDNTPPLWTAAELAKATGGTLEGGETAWSVNGLSIDTRTLQPGDLFVALKGENVDGHAHAAAAEQAGAGGALLARSVSGVTRAVRVADVQRGLEALARSARSRIREEVFAITGSVGKTTTKEMLRTALSSQGRVHATDGNLNNRIGVPLTLARTPKDTQFGVIEVGMNHAGEITPLSRLIRPDVALITTIGVAHIQNFPDAEEGIARAKAEIFAGLTEDGIAILPRDSDFFPLLCDEVKKRGVEEIFSFGTHKASDGRLLHAGDKVEADILGNRISYALQAPGAHMALNSVAVLLALAAVGLDVAAGVKALSAFEPLKWRGRRCQVGGVTVIDEIYSANPQSMVPAIQSLGQASPGPSGRRIAVLGEMLELGDRSESAHVALAGDLARAKVDILFCCGEGMKPLWQALPPARQGAWAPDSTQLAPLVVHALRAGDTVLIKGSRGKQVRIQGVACPSMAVVLEAMEQQIREGNAAYAV